MMAMRGTPLLLLLPLMGPWLGAGGTAPSTMGGEPGGKAAVGGGVARARGGGLGPEGSPGSVQARGQVVVAVGGAQLSSVWGRVCVYARACVCVCVCMRVCICVCA